MRKLTTKQIIAVLEMHHEGVEVDVIKKKVGLRRSSVTSIIHDGLPVFVATKIVRCPECGAKIDTSPCVLCHVKKYPVTKKED